MSKLTPKRMSNENFSYKPEFRENRYTDRHYSKYHSCLTMSNSFRYSWIGAAGLHCKLNSITLFWKWIFICYMPRPLLVRVAPVPLSKWRVWGILISKFRCSYTWNMIFISTCFHLYNTLTVSLLRRLLPASHYGRTFSPRPVHWTVSLD